MAEQIYTHALTTVARVKDQLSITVSGHDSVLTRMINEATDLIETMCDRRFKSTTYVNEVYSHQGGPYLVLKQAPVTALTTFEYAAGYPSNKAWTSFLATEYELSGDGQSGIIDGQAGFPKGSNIMRVSYTAGYLIDWGNAGAATHTLPADLSGLCERLVIRRFKKREAEGKSSESFDGASVTWDTKLNNEDMAIINKYKRLFFV